jgi:hypothetical protein
VSHDHYELRITEEDGKMESVRGVKTAKREAEANERWSRSEAD